MKRIKVSLFIQNHRDSSLTIYLKEINKYRLLTAQEEVELGLKILDGDRQAAEMLVKANLRFVVSVARKYDYSGLPLSDLINEGNLGLMQAAKRFNVNFGYKFITYAVWYIKQSIQRAVKLNATVKVPNNKLETIKHINKSIRFLEQNLHRKPTTAEISRHLNVREPRIKECISYQKSIVSIDEPGYISSLSATLADSNIGIGGLMDTKSVTTILLHLLNTLPKRQSIVVAYYFGIGNFEPKSLDEIAVIMNLSKERVRQLKDIALRELKRRGVGFLGKFGIYPAGK